MVATKVSPTIIIWDMTANGNLAITVVLYNQRLLDTPSGRLLSTTSELRGSYGWLFVDNSESPELLAANAETATSLGVNYLRMAGNVGLARAYNSALSYWATSAEWLIWLDQDTQFQQDYLDSLHSLDARQHLLYVPEIRTAQGVLSPRYFTLDKVHQVLEPPANSRPYLSAINSGMCVHQSVYQEFGEYNEELFLDYVDYDFLWRIYERRPEFQLGRLPIALWQDFSGEHLGTPGGDLARFRHFRQDFACFCARHGVPFRSKWELLLRRAAHLSLHHKSLKFIFEAI